MTKVTISQYGREIDVLQEALSTELSTGSVDKETAGSELDSGFTVPTSGSLRRVPSGMATARVQMWTRLGHERLEPGATCR